MSRLVFPLIAIILSLLPGYTNPQLFTFGWQYGFFPGLTWDESIELTNAYLIFRVAIPAAMPSIFIGLFMGLGTSFLTLIAAETVGVKSGLGYYVSWKQGWAEYAKVYAALIIMAAFFSTIMTVLFKVRDRVLVWQKGVIKW